MIWNRQPALFYGLVNAALALIVSFGLSLSADQIGAILAVTSSLLAMACHVGVVANVKTALYTPVPPAVPTGTEGP
jgi:hypothetical protein